MLFVVCWSKEGEERLRKRMEDSMCSDCMSNKMDKNVELMKSS